MMQESKRSRAVLRDREQGWLVQGYVVWRSNPHFAPPTDVIELADRIRVVVEIAGMRASDFSVSLHSRQLVISGTRERPALPSQAYHQVEIGYGEFRIAINLPWVVRGEGVSASYRDGFLTVDLPREVEKREVIIEVHEPLDDED
jgi:HSP20 family protein